jgi:arginine repressor
MSGQETLLEKARRHVREGAKRVARQEELVALLDQDGNYASQTALAREILVTLLTSLDLMRDHLRRIEGQSES